MPHKSRPPDAISKPSHPQYFHIKEHSQHKQTRRAGPGNCITSIANRLQANLLQVLLLQIQIQIQIESLHTRLDETDEMTNTASLYSRTFSWSAYDESPARCWRPSVRLERAHQAPDQGRRAPIANRVRMGPRQLSCYRSPDPRILSRRRRMWSRGGRTRRPDVGRGLSPQPETQHPPVGSEVLIGPCREPPPSSRPDAIRLRRCGS